MTLVSGTAGSGKTLLAVQFLVAGIVDGDEPGVFVTFEERPQEIPGTSAPSAGTSKAGRTRDSGRSSTPRLTSPTSWSWPAVRPVVLGRARQHAVEDGAEARRDRLHRVADRPVRQHADRPARAAADRGRAPGPRRHDGDDGRAPRRLRPDLALRLRGVRRRQRHHPAQRPGRREAPADPGGPQAARRRAPQGRAPVHHQVRPRHDRRAPGGPELRLRLLARPTAVRHRRARRHEPRRLPRALADPGLGTDRRRQVAAGHPVPRRRGRAGDRCLLFSFEESREQLVRNAWRGVSTSSMEADGGCGSSRRPRRPRRWRITCCTSRPRSTEFQPDRIAIDSLSALHRVATIEELPRVPDGAQLPHQGQRLVGVDDRDLRRAPTSAAACTCLPSPTRSSSCSTSPTTAASAARSTSSRSAAPTTTRTSAPSRSTARHADRRAAGPRNWNVLPEVL